MPSQAKSYGRRAIPGIAPTAKTLFAARIIRAENVKTVETCVTSQDIKVAAIEDDERMRQALVFQVSTAGIEVDSYASAEEFLESANAVDFDCILVDINLPKMNGLQLQEELNRTIPFASIVFITGLGDLAIGMHAMRKGAFDFLEKPIDDETLLSSIAHGAELSRKRRTEHIQRGVLEKRHGCLTAREREVFCLITSGLLNKQAGAELGTTERTVKAHRERVMRKMGAGSLADLVRMAEVLQIRPAHAQAAAVR
jgi:FixJ family two-component response regulator